MFTRIFSLIALTGMGSMLASCGSESNEPEGPDVECAIGPGAELTPVCTLERVSAEEFVIHHPDGGFRKFVREESDPAIFLPADGAEPLMIENATDGSGMIVFTLGTSRYQLDGKLIAPPANE